MEGVPPHRAEEAQDSVLQPVAWRPSQVVPGSPAGVTVRPVDGRERQGAASALE